MEFLKRILTFFICVMISSCGMYWENPTNNTSSVNRRASSITDFSVQENFGNEYTILLVSDVHFDNKYTKPTAMLEKVANLEEKPVACFVLGDLTRNSTSGEFDSYLEFCEDLKNAGIKTVYAIPGNHDADDGGDLFIQKTFPHKSYYRLISNKTSFYFLDSAEGSHGNEQIENLSQIIKSDSRKKFVFSHYPLYVPDSLTDKMNKATERAYLISLFAKNGVSYYFCGHTHEWYSYDFGKFKEEVVGDLRWSGAWALLKINENSGDVQYAKYNDKTEK